MKKRILLSLLCGMFSVAGVFGIIKTGWADAERRLTLPAGLFERSSNFGLRYESGLLDPASLNGSALGVVLFDEVRVFGRVEKVSIASTGTMTGGDLVIEELVIDGLSLFDADGEFHATIDRLNMVSSGTWDGGNLVIEKLEVDGFDMKEGSSEISVGTVLMKSLSVAELMVAGEKVSNAAIQLKGLDPEALQRGDMGPMDQENAMALVGAIKDVAGLLDGFSLTLNDIQVVNDGQSGSLGKVAFGVRDGFWLPEFSIERLNIPNFGGQAVELEAVRFELAGSLSSRLSALFEIVGLALRPGETAPQTVREFFEMLDMEEVVVDFGTQLITTVEQEETLVEINVAFGVPELMGLNIKFAYRSPTNPVAFLGSSKFADLTQEERQAAMKEIMTQGRLDHASVTLTNWNAVDILLKALAQQGGQSEEQLRMTGEMMINRFVGRGTPALAEANDALVAFLKTPGTLQASFRPPKPLPTANTSEFNELVANPAALVDALGLSVKFFDEPMSIESHRLTQPQGLTESKNAGISTNGTPKALPPIPDSNVLDWLSARRAYVEGDYETVLRLMVPHAEIGTESAQRIVAHSYRKTDEFEQAATWYQGLAEKGDAASQFYLGMLYQKGLGVDQDNQVALEWLEKAVAQGDARAIHALALSTQTIEVVKEINPGLSARAKEVLTDVVRHYYDTDDPAGMHFSGKSDVRIPTALWDRVIARWRAEDVMPSHVILQAVAGRDVGKKTSTESPSPESQVAPPEAQGYEEGKVPGTISEGVSKVGAYDEDDLKKVLETRKCQKCNLSRADLKGAYLKAANLKGANLEGANLQEANLGGAYLQRANLKGANLTGTRLIYATLTGINLTGANLTGANLLGVDLNGANLTDANLMGANLNDAKNFNTADTTGATFCQTIMSDRSTNNSGC